jgi:hypothetical protein
MTMDKLTFKKLTTPRVIPWPCIIEQPQDGGKVVKLQLTAQFEMVDPDELAKAISPVELMGRNSDVIVYDRTVKGFVDLPGAESVSPEEVVAEFRKQPDIVKGCARGYFDMINGRVAGN